MAFDKLCINFFNAGKQLPPEFISVILLMPDLGYEEHPACTAYMSNKSGTPTWHFHNAIFGTRQVKETDWWAFYPGVPDVLREKCHD